MEIDPGALDTRERYGLLIASVVPRPIAWVSTRSKEGVVNLAPFSYFSGVCAAPLVVSIACGTRRGGAVKDTLANVEATGELVINVVTESLIDTMVHTSGEYSPEVDELAAAGLSAAPSRTVAPPRVGESPLQLECRLHRLVPVGDPPATLVLAEVVWIHVAEEVLTEGRPDAEKLRPLGRLGGDQYAGLGRVVERKRPRVETAGK